MRLHQTFDSNAAEHEMLHETFDRNAAEHEMCGGSAG